MPIEKIPVSTHPEVDRSDLARRVGLELSRITSARSQPALATRCEIPATLLDLEPQPLSANDDDPVFNERSAAFFLGVSPDCLKKWRQRKPGPDYLQYGANGPVRYLLSDLQSFRDTCAVKMEK